MRRLATRLRAPALLLAALALWLAPFAFEPDATPAPARIVRAATGSSISSPPSAVAAPASAVVPPPAGDAVFTVAENPGVPRAYAVAMDELYFPARPAARRVVAIAPQPDLGSLLSHASGLAAELPTTDAPRLVLYPVGAPRDAVTRRIVNPRIDVALASAAAPSPAPRPDLGIVAWERPAYAPDHAIARIAGDAAQPLRAAAAAAALPGIRSARPLLARQHFPRLVPNDPLFKDQWHLRNTGQQGGAPGVDLRAVAAWDTTQGAGVVIGVVDDGVDLSHPDLSPALNGSLGYDWNGNDSNPSAEGGPYPDDFDGDDHGTAVSGLAAARGDNRVGVAGVAPAATLAALRLIAAPTDDSEDAAAMSWRNDAIAVKNNSWGPADDHPDVFPGGPLWLSAVADGVAGGRGGRGVLYFWAAGNGQRDGDQGTLDGYATARPVIAVAATTNRGAPASFSEGGPHVVVAAAGDASAGVVTTDRTGDYGYNLRRYGYPGEYRGNLDYTRTFAGTSAASPVAAGVGALLLAAHPELGWRDVKEIFLRSSTKLQKSSPDWVSRAAGDAARPIKHHPRFGGGNVNALAALDLARDWRPLDAERLLTAYTPFDFAGAAIPDNPVSSGASVSFEVFEGTSVLRVEHAVVTVNITHPHRADLEITLTSPSGTVSRFTQGKSLLAGADFVDFPFTSVRHWGEPSHFPTSPSRRWTLKVRDLSVGYAGTLNSATLSLYGTGLAAPAVVTAPADQTLATGSTLVLRAAFSGGNLDYTWRRDGQPIAGAETAELRLPNFSAKLVGAYTCTAKNPLGSAEVAANVTLDDSPRDTLAIRAGATTALDLGDYVDGDIKVWKSTALPAGLKLDPVTGLIAGRPTKPGDKPVLVTATASDGTVTKIPLAFTISPLDTVIVGDFVALVSRDPVLNGTLGGALSLKTAANGAASGSLTLGKTAYSFSGLLDGATATEGALDITLPKPALHLVVHLGETDGVATLSGTLTSTSSAEPAASASAAISGARSAWNAKTNPATAYVGSVAAAFLPAPEADLALGASVVTVKITTAGRATWLITPADGSPALTGSAPLTDQGLLFAYARYASSLGSILASIPAPTEDAPALSAEASLDWLRKPAPTLALPDGFAPLELAPVAGGGRHAKPVSGARILGRSESADTLSAATAAGAAQLDAPEPLGANITVTAKNTFAVAAPNPAKLALKFAADTGRITGSYVVASPTRTAKVTAVVLPFANPALALGFSSTPATSGAVPQSAIFLLQPTAPTSTPP